MKRRYYIVLPMLLPLIAWGAAPPAESQPDQLAALVRQVEAGAPLSAKGVQGIPSETLLPALKPLLNHANPAVREHAIAWVSIGIAQASAIKDRQEGVQMLLAVAVSKRDHDDVNALHALLNVARAEDFDAANSAALERMLLDKPPTDVILLAGIAHSETMISILKTMPMEGLAGDRVRRALARAGDPKCGAAILKEYAEAPLEDRMARISLLSYVRTPEAVALLRDYLSSSEEIPSAGDMIGEKLSHVALRELRKIVKDLPSGEKGSPYSVTETDIGNAIRWLTDHPNPEINPPPPPPPRQSPPTFTKIKFPISHASL